MVEQAVVERLQTISTLGTRVYVNTIPQEEQPPFAAIFRIDTNPSNSKDIVSRLDKIRVQVSIFARTYLQAVTIERLVRTALDGYAATISNDSYLFYFDDSRGEYDPSADLQSVTVDFMCTNKRLYIS